MTVDDVVKGLKICATCGSLYDICPKCPYCGGFNCNNRLKEDAAYLIMELQKTLKAVQKNSEINFKMWEEAQAEVERLQVDLEAAYALMEVQEWN